MIAGSEVKISMRYRGKKIAPAANTIPAAIEMRKDIPITFSMVLVSFLPQYWAVSTQAPEVSPKNSRLRIKYTWLANETPERAVSPTLPSMITSVEVTPTLIRFCTAIGMTRRNTSL